MTIWLASPPWCPAVSGDKTWPNLDTVNMLVTSLLAKPTWHCSQETALVSRPCRRGTECGPGRYGVTRPTFALLKWSQFMQNCVSPNKSFMLSHHCCSLSVLCSGCGGGGMQSQHGFKGKTNQEESGRGRKWLGGWVRVCVCTCSSLESKTMTIT